MKTTSNIFTHQELLALCQEDSNEQLSTIMQKTFTGVPVVDGYTPEKTISLKLKRQESDTDKCVIMSSSLSRKIHALSTAKTYIKAKKQINKPVYVESCKANGIEVDFEDVLKELILRPSHLESISIKNEAEFDAALTILIDTKSIFANNKPVKLSTVLDVVGEEEILSHLVNVNQRIVLNGSQEIEIQGIGNAQELEIEIRLGVGYAVI